MAEGIDYPALLRQALLGVVRQALLRATEEGGPPGDHHFYLTFHTAHPGVEMPPGLRARWPGEMTIVLQHQFWNLQVDEESFGVTLRFGGAPQRLVVPYAALTSFSDPAGPFGLKFEAGPAEEAQAETPTALQTTSAAAPVTTPTEGAPAGKLLGFRKKTD